MIHEAQIVGQRERSARAFCQNLGACNTSHRDLRPVEEWLVWFSDLEIGRHALHLNSRQINAHRIDYDKSKTSHVSQERPVVQPNQNINLLLVPINPVRAILKKVAPHFTDLNRIFRFKSSNNAFDCL